ncbi:MAG: phosphatidate cytidylyltransferase [Fimbriimonadaceae bacterium]|nr:phosphatidate cytidylyltransferase [Fimbriimonadaceae bacterium]QYK57975.1 MAG: phosphatidate cytidylyltransferase [Fimbriimonadaceae bacterium]
MFAKRAATAVAGSIIALAVVLSTHAWPILALSAIVLAAGFRELLLIAQFGTSWRRAAVVLALSATLPWLVPGVDLNQRLAILGLVYLIGLWGVARTRGRSRGSPWSAAWIGGPFATAFIVHQTTPMATGPWAPNGLLLVLVPIWIGDTAAYIFGRVWGRTKLAPGLSPSKTWEGAWANLGGSVLAGGCVAGALGVPWTTGVAVGLVASVFGQAGDLLQSSLKRAAGVKDSGDLLPGHGGALDRMDSFLLAALPASTVMLVLSPSLFRAEWPGILGSVPVIETRELTKSYELVKKQPGVWGSIKSLVRPEKIQVEAVKKVNLSVDGGEIVGFLGPNGAGKTTTLKMLTGILHPTSGEARVLGYRPFDRRPEMLRQIALVMGNRQQLWWDLPAMDSFVVLRELYDIDRDVFRDRIDFLLTTLDLTDKVNTQVRKLSLGERMKCELVAALLHGPRVIFLDEPTIGLDVVSQKRIRDFLRDFNRREGCTIVLTSHYMQDVQELCERVVVIDHGTLVFEGTLDTLTAAYAGTRRLRLTFDDGAVPDLAEYGQVIQSEDRSVVLSVPRERTASVTGAILQSYPVHDIAVEDVSADEVIRDLFARSAT